MCQEAEAIVAQECAKVNVAARIVDVDNDDELSRQYTDHVPVLFVDGKLHGYWFVDDTSLGAALAAEPHPMADNWRPPAI